MSFGEQQRKSALWLNSLNMWILLKEPLTRGLLRPSASLPLCCTHSFTFKVYVKEIKVIAPTNIITDYRSAAPKIRIH